MPQKGPKIKKVTNSQDDSIAAFFRSLFNSTSTALKGGSSTNAFSEALPEAVKATAWRLGLWCIHVLIHGLLWRTGNRSPHLSSLGPGSDFQAAA